MRLRRIVIIFGLLLALSASPASATSNPPTPYSKYLTSSKPIMSDKFWTIIATCETGFNLEHSTRNYTSALGIARGTWHRWAPAKWKSGNGRTWKEQKFVAESIAFKGTWFPIAERFKYPVGPWGWACLKMRPEAQGLLCKSRHPLVQKWKRGC